MLTLTDYDNHSEQKYPVNIPTGAVNSISFGYDRGRISLSINNEPVFEHNGGASDVSLEINRQTMPQPIATVALKSRCEKCDRTREQFIPFSAFTPIGFGEFCFGVTQNCACGHKHEIRIQTKDPKNVGLTSPKFRGCRVVSVVPFRGEDTDDE